MAGAALLQKTRADFVADAALLRFEKGMRRALSATGQKGHACAISHATSTNVSDLAPS